MNVTKIINLLLLVCLLLSCKSENKTADPYAKISAKADASYKSGKSIYESMCITCHMADGKGVEKVFPPLANSDYLKENQEASVKAIKYGMSGELVVNGVTYNSVMAPVGLSDKEVSDVMNYINKAWGNNINKRYTEEDVAKIKK